MAWNLALLRQLTGASGAITAEIGVAEHIIRRTRQQLKDAGAIDAVDPPADSRDGRAYRPGKCRAPVHATIRLDRLLALAITAMFSRRDFDSSA
jgi:hypothetical protein